MEIFFNGSTTHQASCLQELAACSLLCRPPPPVLMPHGYIRSQPSYIPTIDDCNCKLRCILTIHPHVYCSEPLTVTLGVPGISAWAG